MFNRFMLSSITMVLITGLFTATTGVVNVNPATKLVNTASKREVQRSSSLPLTEMLQRLASPFKVTEAVNPLMLSSESDAKTSVPKVVQKVTATAAVKPKVSAVIASKPKVKPSTTRTTTVKRTATAKSKVVTAPKLAVSATRVASKAPAPTPKPVTKVVAAPKLLTSRTTAPSRSTTSSVALRIVSVAKSLLGVPYVWGGTTPNGFDCSGFTQYTFARNGITLKRTAREQYTQGTRVSINELRAGDLLFFTTYAPGASHVGIYIGNNKFIHESSGAGKSIISDLSGYYTSHYIGAKRIVN